MRPSFVCTTELFIVVDDFKSGVPSASGVETLRGEGTSTSEKNLGYTISFPGPSKNFLSILSGGGFPSLKRFTVSCIPVLSYSSCGKNNKD